MTSIEYKIKVCGMRDIDNIKALIKLPIQFIGYIFYPRSKRYVGESPSHEIFNIVPATIKKVGVFVNEEKHKVIELAKRYGLQFVQLHGNETVDDCRVIKEHGIGVIKAFSATDKLDFQQSQPYLNVVDYFLFDTATADHGGSGKKFNWEILKHYPFEKPFFLAGGIGRDDAKIINQLYLEQLQTIDINSKFEIEPGLKDISMLTHFINELTTIT